MNYRNMSAAAGLAIATQIRYAIFDDNRTYMANLDRRHGGIRRITKILVAAGFLTPAERKAAINQMPRIRNNSCKIRI